MRDALHGSAWRPRARWNLLLVALSWTCAPVVLAQGQGGLVHLALKPTNTMQLSSTLVQGQEGAVRMVEQVLTPEPSLMSAKAELQAAEARSVLAQSQGGLVRLVEQALASEPSLMSARAELQAAEARYDQSAGGLLPQIRASASTGYNVRNYTTRPRAEDSRAVDLGTEDEQNASSLARTQAVTERGRYNASGGEISLTLPVFRPVSIIEKRQSATVVQQVTSELEATRQELIHRVVDAWLEVLSARQESNVAREKELAAERQMTLVKKGAALGTYSLPDQEEAVSQYRTAQAEHRAASSEQRLRQLALEQLVGGAVDVPAWIAPTSLDEILRQPMARWLQEAEQPLDVLESELLLRNPSIQAATLALESAKQSVTRSKAGHLPTLDFTLTAARNAQGLGISAGQAGFSSKVGTVALDLRIPIYSGGIDSARVREMVAKLTAAEHALDGARRKVISELHQAWYAGEVARARISAGEQALRAGAALFKQAERGLSQGMKSELDVVQAGVQWQTAKRDHQRAMSDLIRSAVRIKTLMANMDVEGLAAIERFLVMPQPKFHGQSVASGRRL